MVTNRELYEALKTIQQVCKDNKGCDTCPLGRECADGEDYDCAFSDGSMPSYWKLVEPPDITWRVMK